MHASERTVIVLNHEWHNHNCNHTPPITTRTDQNDDQDYIHDHNHSHTFKNNRNLNQNNKISRNVITYNVRVILSAASARGWWCCWGQLSKWPDSRWRPQADQLEQSTCGCSCSSVSHDNSLSQNSGIAFWICQDILLQRVEINVPLLAMFFKQILLWNSTEDD